MQIWISIIYTLMNLKIVNVIIRSIALLFINLYCLLKYLYYERLWDFDQFIAFLHLHSSIPNNYENRQKLVLLATFPTNTHPCNAFLTLFLRIFSQEEHKCAFGCVSNLSFILFGFF